MDKMTFSSRCPLKIHFFSLPFNGNVMGVVAVIFFVQRPSNLHFRYRYIPAIMLPAKQLYSVVDPYFGIIALSTTHFSPVVGLCAVVDKMLVKILSLHYSSKTQQCLAWLRNVCYDLLTPGCLIGY